MKHIIGFSGGIASAVCAKIVHDEFWEDTILLFHNTKTEPKDNDRFRAEVAAFIGLPIVEDNDGRDIWQIFDDNNYLGNGRNTMCSRILKQERSMAYMIENQPAFLYIGFTCEETKRVQATAARYAHKGITVKFPLIENNIGKDECMERVKTCWGIEPPSMYSWAPHANCVPCIKGKKAYWGLIHMFEREAWEKASNAEKQFGKTIFTEAGSLEEELDNCLRLAKKYLEKKEAKENQLGLFDFPCECML